MEEDDDLWQQYLEVDDDDSGGGPDSQDLSSSPSSYLAGFVIANIVGLRYYSGTISGREMVGLVREPLNPHDSNAIKVLNTRMAQVGHIERSVAAVLAPLLDSRLLSVEGIVPKPPKNRNPYRLPCQVHIFAHPDAIPLVRDALDRGGLQLIDESDPQFALSEAAIVQERNSNSKSKAGNGAQRIDDIFALVGKDDEEKSVQLEPPKEVVVSELYAHQKEGLGWLVRRENSSELPPFWEDRSGKFVNVLTNYQTHERPEPLRGGIFADDMGLGKTLTLLSLIASNRPVSTSSSSVNSLGGEDETSRTSVRQKKSNSGKNAGRARKRRKLDDGVRSTEVLGPKTTLVVCPPSVFSSWITQLEEHTRPGSLKVYLYHGERTRETKELLRYDIVLTTYSTLAAEFSDPESPMKEIEWLRVILDEAHLIKNFAAQQTKAVIALKAERRWAVTGTPIQNSSFDLFSLMAFLRFQPFSIKYYWQSLIQRPLAQESKSGLSRLQALMGTISLRRTKDNQSGNKSMVGLPTKTIETCVVELSAEERVYYDHMESEAQNTICNHMALCPSDIKSFLPSDTIEDVTQNPELLKKLASLVEDGDDFDCPVCLSPPIKAVITCCAHIFCQACILRTLKHLNACCPICRHPLSKSDLFLAPSTESSKDDESKAFVSGRPVSSKVSTLLKLLLETKKQNHTIKSVIFSQFRKMLLLLEEPLRSAGFGILRLDGSMSARKRSEVIKEFGKSGPGAPTVLLASLRAAGAGVNLTAASRVYLVEPWWNPALEEQAMDRVHRIGQQQEVRVVRLIVRGSIEERILELQERKKKLASGAFGSKAAKEQKQMRVEDVRIMMHL
ncbi:SWI/SNF-related matrix-associated actin-dependent regulator of chromatin subfamily A member 3-like 1 [Cocos nucifera]|uniref:SWI/SNF-related matrix-associated actin-dependent regulator of chromatin subfamily A member 3-like 1 n=1 Tax=Cocos nucifera TaxID=13894 RepID=A0A8K0MVI8_COCNU|nr:SWI/SNF-related matrix-associated actin-dependent regulator of chromatin subfamily A member 3-like 1 [Cocos nucifera]